MRYIRLTPQHRSCSQSQIEMLTGVDDSISTSTESPFVQIDAVDAYWFVHITLLRGTLVHAKTGKEQKLLLREK